MRSSSLLAFAVSALEAADSRVLFVDFSGSLIPSSEATVVDVTNLQSIITRSLGVSPLQHTVQDPELLLTSFFKSARANLVMTVEDAGEADDFKFLDSFFKDEGDSAYVVRSASLSGVQSARPASMFASITTGLPTSHQHLQSANGVADILAETFQGQSLTVAMGSNSEQARAFCAHAKLQSASTFCFNAQGQDEALPVLDAVPHDKLGELQSLLQKEGVAKFENGMFSSLDNGADLKASSVFVSEMRSALWLLNALEHGSLHQLTTDNVPDFFTMSFASLKSVSSEYGSGSSEVRLAKQIMDTVFKQVVLRFSAVYPERGMVELVLLGQDQGQGRQSRRLLSAAGPQAKPSCVTNSTLAACDEIDRFHIVLWLSVIMGSGLMMAVYALAFMPFKKDTMLYGNFNPGWETRKRQ